MKKILGKGAVYVKIRGETYLETSEEIKKSHWHSYQRKGRVVPGEGEGLPHMAL